MIDATSRVSEDHFQVLFDAHPVAVYSCDAAGVIQRFNRRAAELWGREPKLGDTNERYCGSLKLFRPDGSVMLHDQCPMAEVVSGRSAEVRDAEVLIERPDHSQITAVVNISPLKDPQGALIGAINCFYDVSERKEAEALLRRNRDTFSSLIQNAPFGLYIVDADFRLRQVSTASQKVFSNVKPLIGRDFGEVLRAIWAEPFASEALERFRHTLESGEPYAANSSNARRDIGEVESYDWKIERVTLPDGQFGVVCYFHDITERRQMEAALRESAVRYRRLFESARDGVLILDAVSGKIIDANPFVGQLLDYTHEEFIGRELWQIGVFSDRPACEAAIKALRENSYVHYDYLPLQGSRGQQIAVEVIANAYQEGENSVIQCNLRDISERNRLERQTREQADTLSDLHRRKDEFLAMLSHELRNPLAPISNAVHLLRLQENPDALVRQASTIIERQVGQLTRLIDGLLEVSRITSGKIHLRKERLSLNHIVENAVETVRPLIGQRGHSLKLSLAPQPICLHADPSRLEQVVVNLLTNAAKFTEANGYIWLSIRQNGNEAVLRVRDSGIGITPDLLPHVFDPFTQAERTLDRAQGGLGIGLCLVQRLVELHRGSVAVYSTLGEGSEFVVRLPGVLTPALEFGPAGDETLPVMLPLRVLAVADNVDMAESLALLVQASGHEVRIAHDGPATVQTALEFRPDVVLLDIGLPGMNGFDVARRLRRQSTLGNLVLVALSGYDEETDRQRSREVGFDHHLAKPADFDKIQKILESAAEAAARSRRQPPQVERH